MAAFGWSRDFVNDELTSAEGWVWYNFALENETSFWGGKPERKTLGYVGQERERILNQWMQAKSV